MGVEGLPAVIFDNGSAVFKVGLAGDHVPRTNFPSVIGRPKSEMPNLSRFYVGKEAYCKKDVLELQHPIDTGENVNWDDVEKVWDHAYKCLMVDSKKHKLMITESNANRTENRIKMTQIAFEKFQVPAMFMYSSGELSLYASGRTTGIVIDCGHSWCYTEPIHRGIDLSHTVRRLDIGGRDITNSLTKMINEGDNTFNFETFDDKEIVRDMKEKICFVAFDYDATVPSIIGGPQLREQSYKLPDGRTVRLGKERYHCSEPLFRPSLLGKTQTGVHKLIYDTIMSCDPGIRKKLFDNIILAGGTTFLPGFGDRLRRELRSVTPNSITIRMIAPADRKDSAWIGGAVIAAMSTFQGQWVTKEQYEEYGETVVSDRCF